MKPASDALRQTQWTHQGKQSRRNALLWRSASDAMRQTQQTQQRKRTLRLGDYVIERKNSTKFLGVTLDKNLNWLPHVRNVCRKVAKFIPILCTVRQYIDDVAVKMIYYSPIYPLITYCSSLWGNCAASHIRPLIVLQKKLVRVMTRSDFRCHTTLLFENLNLLNVKQINKYFSLLYVHRNLFPATTNSTFRHYGNLSYPTRYNDSGNLIIRRTRIEFGKKSIKVYGSALFNDLPLVIKECCDLSMFKRKLKKWIIHEYCSFLSVSFSLTREKNEIKVFKFLYLLPCA